MISTLCIRANHKHVCEDSLFINENDEYIWGGIFDGCSSGVDSKLASLLAKYCMKKWMNYKFLDLEDNLINFFSLSFCNAINILELSIESTWTTINLFAFNKKTKELKVRIFGDGVFFVNDKKYKTDLNDKVDYIGNILYGLNGFEDLIVNKRLQQYLDSHPVIAFDPVESFKICSDGIDAIERSQFLDTPKVLPDILLANPSSENYLQRMYNLLVKDKYIFKDDLSIISYNNPII